MLFIIFFAVALAQDELCGDWNPLLTSGAKCAPAQSCCQAPQATPNICSTPLTASSTTFITQEEFQFATNGRFSIVFTLGTGQCPLLLDSGTLTAAITTVGTYIDAGPNSFLEGGWQQLRYSADTFEATLTKSNKASFFTPGTNVRGTQVGPCIDLQRLFEDDAIGCPCNGTWDVDPFVNGISNATRTIQKSQCVDENGTSTCPENFFFQTIERYGNFRVYNTSNDTMRMLEITRPSLDNKTAYNDSTVYASFIADFSCPTEVIVLTPTVPPSTNPATGTPTGTPTGAPTLLSVGKAGILIPFSVASLSMTALFV